MRTRQTAALAASIGLALAGTAAMAATPAAPPANALPGQGKVLVGGATGAVTGSTLTVTLPADSVINWGGSSASTAINPTGTAGFNVGSGAKVTFSGPSSVLNVDVSGNPSQIFGKLDGGNAIVYVANSNGIIVGTGGSISSTGSVGLIGNTLINADGTPFTGAAYPAGGPSYMGTGGDVTVQPGATISGGTVLISGGGNVNVDLGSLAGAGTYLQAGFPNSTNALVKANSGATLTVTGALGGASLNQFASAGNATVNGTLDTTNLVFGTPYIPGTANYDFSDVVGTFTNNGVVDASTGGFDVSGALVNYGKFDATGIPMEADGGIANFGSLLADNILSGAFTNQGTVTSTYDVMIIGGDFNNAGSFSTGTVLTRNGGVVNSGKLTVTDGHVITSSDGKTANGFAASADYSITNSGTINSPLLLTLSANLLQTGGSPIQANGTTGSVNSSGVLQVGTGATLTLAANNNVSLSGAVQTPRGAGYASTRPGTGALGTFIVIAGAYNNAAAYGPSGAGVFNTAGGVTIATDIFSNSATQIWGNWVEMMGNLGGDNISGNFTPAGSASANGIQITAGAAPSTGYAVRVAAGKVLEAGIVIVDGVQAGDTPNVILQGTLAGDFIAFGQSNPVGDIFSGAAGGMALWSTAVAPAPSNTTLAINSVGRVKVAPYLNAANFRFNGLPVMTLDGSTVNLTVNADNVQGTPTSGYNLLVNSGVNIRSYWTGLAPINGNGSAVTGVTVIPNSHFVLQSAGNIATVGNFYWPGYIYLGNINSDSDGNPLPGTLGVGTITTTGAFSNVLPGDTAGASGIHFITQFPMTIGGRITTNDNAWVNFGSDAVAQLYRTSNGPSGPFFGGMPGPGVVINYGPLAPESFATHAPDPIP